MALPKMMKKDNFVVIYVKMGIVQDYEAPPWIDVYVVDYDLEDLEDLEEREELLAEIAQRKEKASWTKNP